MSPTPRRPERPKNRLALRHFFRELCSECGRYHLYRTYPGWNTAPNHLALCRPKRHDQRELDL